MLIKSEQLSVGSLIKNVMLKYLFWASYILRLCAQTCTPNRHALEEGGKAEMADEKHGPVTWTITERPVGAKKTFFWSFLTRSKRTTSFY